MTTPSRSAGYRNVLTALNSSQKRRAPGAPMYSIYVNRRVGRYVAAWAFTRGLSPNQVTGISALLTFSAIVGIATIDPMWWSGLLIWLLLALGYAFDSADGQVARLQGGGSPAGEWLDHVVDAAKTASLHLAVLISMYRFFDLDHAALLLIPIAFCVVASVQFFAQILNDLLSTIHGDGLDTTVRSSTPLRSLLLLPTDYGLICLMFVLIGFPVVFLAAYSMIFIVNAVFLALALVKWFGRMQRLGVEGNLHS